MEVLHYFCLCNVLDSGAYAQRWTALFRAFSSHRQPSASLTKLFPFVFFLLQNYEKRTEHNMSLFFGGGGGFLEMCGVSGMVVVLRTADTFSSIHSRSE